MTEISINEKRVVWLAAAIQLVNIIDFMMVMPLAPDIAKIIAISNSDIGYIGGSYTLAVAISSLICAKFIDRFDRKTVAVVTVAGLSLATFGATLAWDLASLITARILAGVFGGPATAIAFSMVTDMVPPERRGKAMAIVMGSFSISAVIAVPFGLELARIGGWQMPFYAVAALGALVTVITHFLAPSMTAHRSKKDLHHTRIISLIVRRDVQIALLIMGTSLFASFLLVPNFSAYYQFNLGVSRAHIGLLYFVGGVFSIFTMQIGGRLSDKVGPMPVVLVGTVVMLGITYYGFARYPNIPAVIVFMLFMGSTSMRNVSASAEASKVPHPWERGAFMSLLNALQNIASGLAAFIAAGMMTAETSGKLVGIEKVAWLAIIVAILQPVLLAKLKRQQVVNPAIP